jgi:hypothetical protein
MKEQFVPYELALRLKELGFDEPCISHYTVYGKFSNDYSAPRKYNSEFELGSYISAPTLSQAFRWFREKYGLDSFCRQTTLDGRSYFKISKIETDEIIKGYSNFTTTYESAELACLDKLIEIVETKQQEQ